MEYNPDNKHNWCRANHNKDYYCPCYIPKPNSLKRMETCRYTNSIDNCIFADGNRAWTGVDTCKRFRSHIFCKYYKSLKDLENGGSGSVLE